MNVYLNIFLQQVVSGDLTDVNKVLNYVLGALVFAIGYVYREKNLELKELNKKISDVYDAHKDDLKKFSEQKHETIVDVNTTMNKIILLLDQLKELLKNGN